MTRLDGSGTAAGMILNAKPKLATGFGLPPKLKKSLPDGLLVPTLLLPVDWKKTVLAAADGGGVEEPFAQIVELGRGGAAGSDELLTDPERPRSRQGEDRRARIVGEALDHTRGKRDGVECRGPQARYPDRPASRRRHRR